MEWAWLPQDDSALDTAKQLLKYCDLHDEVTLQCDACKTGTALLQNGQPVAFTFRTLTPTEQRYAQTEEECLAIVFACDKFDQYLHGWDCITVHSDHKPLVIFRKSLLTAPKQLHRMLLRLQTYNLEVTYKQGKDHHAADFLSRTAQSHNATHSNSNASQHLCHGPHYRCHATWHPLSWSAEKCWHGVLHTVTTDNGPLFSTMDFQTFSEAWDIEHLTSSPFHSQSNGKTELAVNIAKNLLKKVALAGQMRGNTGMTENTPTEGRHSSPAQLLLSRCTCIFLPSHVSLLKSKVMCGLLPLKQMKSIISSSTMTNIPKTCLGDSVQVLL